MLIVSSWSNAVSWWSQVKTTNFSRSHPNFFCSCRAPRETKGQLNTPLWAGMDPLQRQILEASSAWSHWKLWSSLTLIYSTTILGHWRFSIPPRQSWKRLSFNSTSTCTSGCNKEAESRWVLIPILARWLYSSLYLYRIGLTVDAAPRSYQESVKRETCNVQMTQARIQTSTWMSLQTLLEWS